MPSAVAVATARIACAEGIRRVAEAIKVDGGHEAVQLRVAEQYITQFGNLAKTNNTMIIPSTLTDISSMIASAMTVIRQGDGGVKGRV